MAEEAAHPPDQPLPPVGGGVTGDYVAGDKHLTLTAAGDIVGRDKIVNHIQNIAARALSAAEEADQAQAFERKRLAEGVGALLGRLQAAAERAGEAPSGGNPYKGLLAYRLSDAEIFFGRRRALADLADQLERGPLTILHSESGAGKTSLLQAGLAPALFAAGHLPLYLRAHDADPGHVLKRAFLPDLGSASRLAAAPLRAYLGEACAVLGPATVVYVFLDQFEEFFTRLPQPERDGFVRALAECLDDNSLNVRWLLSLRSEYFGDLAGFRPLVRNPFANDFRLERLTRAEAREVIVRPAEQRGVAFEAGLVERLLDDLGRQQIAPPQLQLVCSTLFRGLGPGERSLTQAQYEAEGGAAGILRGHLERVLSQDLPREQRGAARRLLEALVSSEQQRVQRTQAELAAELSARGMALAVLDALLNQLVESRLVKAEEAEAGLVYELAHDYLLDEIKLDPDVQARKAAQELLDQEVRAYRRYQTLLSTDRLSVIEPYQADLRLSPEAEQLLAESQAAVQRSRLAEEVRRQKELEDARRLAEETEARRTVEARRAREAEEAAARLRLRSRIITGVSALALVAAIGAGVLGLFATRNAADALRNAQTAQAANTQAAINLGGAQSANTQAAGNLSAAQAAGTEAARQRDEAVRLGQISLAGQLAAQALAQLDQRIDLALLLAVEAEHVTSTVETRGSLLTALQHSRRIDHILAGHTVFVSGVVFSPDGALLASAGEDPTTLLWDLTSPGGPQILSTLDGLTPTFRPDGEVMATSARDDTIRLWEVARPASPRLLATLEALDVARLAFSPDGELLAGGNCLETDPATFACTRGEVTLWDVGDPSAPRLIGAPLSGHAGRVAGLAFSPDGQTLASGSDDNVVMLWDVADPAAPRLLGQPLAGRTRVQDLFFSADGARLTASPCRSDDSTGSSCPLESVVMWNVSDPAAPLKIVPGLEGQAGQASVITLSADGQTLAAADRDDQSIALWDVSNPFFPRRLGKSLAGHLLLVSGLAFSPDGKTLASGSRDNSVILWNVADLDKPSGLGPTLIQHQHYVLSVAYSPDGKTLASASRDGTIALWDVSGPAAPGAPLAVLDEHQGAVWRVSFSPDGRTMASAGRDGRILLWDVSGPAAPRVLGPPLTEHTDIVEALVFSPDGTLLTSAGQDSQIILRDVSDPSAPRLLATLRPEAFLLSLAISRDGRTLAAGGSDGKITLWDISDPAVPRAYGGSPVASLAYVMALAFTPDGRVLASADILGEIRLWDASHRDEPRLLGTPLRGHTASVESLALSPDGRWLASGSADDTIIVWDISDPAAPRVVGAPLAGHTDYVFSVAFSPDGRELASGSADGTVIVWDIDVASWIHRACRIAYRNLTRAEWQQYLGNEPYRRTCEDLPPGE